MLSSLDALANKISSGSGQNSASQQQQQTTHSSVCLDTNYHQLQHIKNSLTGYHNTTPLYQQQQQSSQLRRLSETLYNGLDSNENKLCHITHNSMHPYQKQPISPPVNRQHQRQKLSNFSSHTSITSASSSEESLRKQHELYQKELQRQSHEFFVQQQHQQKQLQSSSHSTSCPPLVFDENDSQQDFANCLKKNTFGMSDKSSTSNSLPNSPIHTNNNNSTLLKSNTNDISNNNNINNNNAYTVDDDVRMDADVTYSEKEPDPDNIKMFVGQVPKSMDEAQLREMFEEYGPVHSINVLRDKTTGISKGCCFVTFYTRRAALKAQDALHNIKTLKGMYHPIQMKPADSENRNDEVSGNSTFNSKSKSHRNNVSYTGINTNRQLTSVIDNITLDNGASVVDKTLNSLATSISVNQKFITSVPSSLALVPTLTTFRSKPYASINATYWLPLRNPSPYSVPERKLFVGMLNKKLNENDVRKLFEGHGNIEECTVLRDQNGQSKGCAFVTFSSKHAAISAIKTLNQNKTMEGCTSPLVVKFADTQKEKEQKKIQQIQANLWNLATNINIPLGPTPTTVSTPIIANPPQQTSPVLGADAITPTSLQLLQQLQAVGFQQQLLQGLGAQSNTADATAATAAAAAGLLPSMTVQNLAALAAMTQPPLTTAVTNAGSGPLTNTAALLWSDPNALASVYMSTAAGLQQFGSAALSTSPLASVALTTAAAAAAGKQIEGPEGCNLFIYHLPQEFTDTDLASTFLPFGNVISAKVFIDKQTNLSKCFGFVSFDHPESAQVAIKAMNGFQVGTKRLKVQLKKPKDVSKPY